MTRSIPLLSCLIAALGTGAALAQVASTHPDSSIQTSASSSPVAFVYVSGTLSGKTNEIHAYAAAANGRLTPISGSPFKGSVGSMAVAGKHLFGASTTGGDIYTYTILSDGALKLGASANAAVNGCKNGSRGELILDHSGANLYDLNLDGDAICSNNVYQSFRIERPGDKLNYIGGDEVGYWASGPLSITGNNKYAYGASCDNDMYWEIFGMQRNGDGTLTSVNINAPTPTPKKVDQFFCPSLTASDPTNHVAISLQAVTQDFTSDGPTQLATYTVDNAGNLTTNSTYANMPATAVGYVSDMRMSPNGKLLAVGGTSGLQIFHFNGSQPITHYTGLLTQSNIDQFFWDNADHLYAISQSAGKLYVFTITQTGVSQAAGSPYTITKPQSIIVRAQTPKQ